MQTSSLFPLLLIHVLHLDPPEILSTSPSSHYLPLSPHQLQNQTELRVNNAERAAFFLDAALAARRSSRAPNDQEARRNSHFLFTLHLYQERLDKSSKAASQCVCL